jgi:hypothetical protein
MPRFDGSTDVAWSARFLPDGGGCPGGRELPGGKRLRRRNRRDPQARSQRQRRDGPACPPVREQDSGRGERERRGRPDPDDDRNRHRLGDQPRLDDRLQARRGLRRNGRLPGQGQHQADRDRQERLLQAGRQVLGRDRRVQGVDDHHAPGQPLPRSPGERQKHRGSGRRVQPVQDTELRDIRVLHQGGGHHRQRHPVGAAQAFRWQHRVRDRHEPARVRARLRPREFAGRAG